MDFRTVPKEARLAARAIHGWQEKRERTAPRLSVQVLAQCHEYEHHRSRIIVKMVAAAQSLGSRETDRRQRTEPDQSLEREATSKKSLHCNTEHRYAEQH